MTAYTLGILLCFLGLAPIATHLVVRGPSVTIDALRGVSTTWEGRIVQLALLLLVAGLFFAVLSAVG